MPAKIQLTKLMVASTATLLLAACAAAQDSQNRSTGTVIDDATITANVKAKLIDDTDTKARQINVETSKGVVQLNGFVDSQTARNEAGRIAQGTDGVKQVRNNLVVRADDRTTEATVDDAAITAKVDAALATDKRTSALAIDVATRDGDVQLSGYAKSSNEKAAAAEVARNVNGVRSVRNEIDIR